MAGLPGICMDGHAYILYARYRIMLRDIPIGEENVRRFFVVAMYEGGYLVVGLFQNSVIPSVGIEPTTLGLLDPRSNQLSYEGSHTFIQGRCNTDQPQNNSYLGSYFIPLLLFNLSHRLTISYLSF